MRHHRRRVPYSEKNGSNVQVQLLAQAIQVLQQQRLEATTAHRGYNNIQAPGDGVRHLHRPADIILLQRIAGAKTDLPARHRIQQGLAHCLQCLLPAPHQYHSRPVCQQGACARGADTTGTTGYQSCFTLQSIHCRHKSSLLLIGFIDPACNAQHTSATVRFNPAPRWRIIRCFLKRPHSLPQCRESGPTHSPTPLPWRPWRA